MPNLILDLMVDRVDLVDEGANSAAHIRLYKRKEIESNMELTEILAKMKPEHKAVIEAEIVKAKEAGKEEVKAETDEKVKDAETKVEDMKEEVKKAKEALQEVEIAKAKTAEPDFEEVMKGLDPAVQEVFKSMKAQKEAAEAVALQASEKAMTEQAIAKAKELKSIPVEEAKLVEVMKGITPEIHEILKAANKAIEDNGLFDEVGKAKGSVVGTADEAWAKIEKAAGIIELEEKVSKAKAIAEATKRNPDLYREYLKGGTK